MPWSSTWETRKPYSEILREHNKIGDDLIKKASEEIRKERETLRIHHSREKDGSN